MGRSLCWTCSAAELRVAERRKETLTFFAEDHIASTERRMPPRPVRAIHARPRTGVDVDDDQQATIIRDVYAAALDERPWRDALEGIAALLGATSVFLFTPFVDDSEGGFSAFHGLPEDEAKKFLREVATVDVWYHALIRRHGTLHTGLQWQSDALIAEPALRQTRFFVDHLRPCGITRCLGVIVGDGTVPGMPLAPLCVYRPPGSEPFSASDERELAALWPHVSQAIQVRQRLRAAACDHAALVLEKAPTAIVVLARDRRILLANPAAEAMFAEPALPAFTRCGRLVADEPARLTALEQALAACASCRFDAPVSLSVRLAGAPGSGVVARVVPPPRGGGARRWRSCFLRGRGKSRSTRRRSWPRSIG